MDTRDKNKWLVRGAVLAIFLLGFVAGILTLNVYKNLYDGSRGHSRELERVEQVFEQLSLTETQQAEVRSVLDDARNQIREMRRIDSQRKRDIRRQTDERLQKILTPEQWQTFQQSRSKTGKRGHKGKSSDHK